MPINDKETFWIYGKHAVTAALENKNREVLEVVTNQDINDPELKTKNSNTTFHKTNINKIVNKYFKEDKNIVHQGYFARIAKDKLETLEQFLKKNKLNKLTFVILDGISDQRNIGSIIRSCLAFNVDLLLVNKKNFNERSSQMYKSASGSIEYLKIATFQNTSNLIEILKKNNFWIYGMTGKANKKIEDEKWSERNAFIFGSENKGLKELTLKKIDYALKININNLANSLNVSNAVTACLSIYRSKN